MNGINGLRMVCPANLGPKTPTMQPYMPTLGYCPHLELQPFTKVMSMENMEGLTPIIATCSVMLHN